MGPTGRWCCRDLCWSCPSSQRRGIVQAGRPRWSMARQKGRRVSSQTRAASPRIVPSLSPQGQQARGYWAERGLPTLLLHGEVELGGAWQAHVGGWERFSDVYV